MFSAVSFIAYGLGCLFSDYMRQEFARYGLPSWRQLTGFLELIGAAGLLIGWRYPVIGLLAAAGLAVLMVLGFGVRLRIKDGVLRSLPALVYCILNLYLVAGFMEIRDQATF